MFVNGSLQFMSRIFKAQLLKDYSQQEMKLKTGKGLSKCTKFFR